MSNNNYLVQKKFNKSHRFHPKKKCINEINEYKLSNKSNRLSENTSPHLKASLSHRTDVPVEEKKFLLRKIVISFYNERKKIKIIGETKWPENFNKFQKYISESFFIPTDELKHLKISYLDDKTNIIIINDENTYKAAVNYFTTEKVLIPRLSIQFTKECKLFNKHLIEHSNHQMLNLVKNKILLLNKNNKEGEIDYSQINVDLHNFSIKEHVYDKVGIKTLKEFFKQGHIKKHYSDRNKQIKNKYFKKLLSQKCAESLAIKKTEANKKVENEEKIRKAIIKEFQKFEEEIIKKLTPLTISNNSSKNLNIPGSQCILCKNSIIGIRYSCVICPNYYLCESCEDKENHIHDLLKQRNPKFQNQFSICSVCKKPITKVLFRCSECNNYYLCRVCEEKENHDHDLTKSRLNN